MQWFSRGSSVAQTIFWTGLASVTTLSLLPIEHLPDEVGLVWDKAQHSLGFAALAVLGRVAYPGRLWSVAFGLIFAGAFIEVMQEVSGWRQGDVLDLLADAAGIGLGLIAYRIARQVRQGGTTG